MKPQLFEYEVQGDYGQGFECVNTELNRKDGLRSLEEYNENEPQYAHRLVKKRIVKLQLASTFPPFGAGAGQGK